jgi:hypothetical protein
MIQLSSGETADTLRNGISDNTLTLQKLRMLFAAPAIGEISGVKGEAVVTTANP